MPTSRVDIQTQNPVPIRQITIAVLVTSFIFSANVTQAQESRTTALSVSLGAVENLSRIGERQRYAFYPEVELYTDLYDAADTGVTFGGSVYAAGWTDGIESTTGCADCILHSYTSAILGLRAMARLDHFLLPLTFWGGASEHFLWADYVAGAGVGGELGQDSRDAYTAIESGIGLYIPVHGPWGIRWSGHVHLPVLVGQEPRYAARFASSVGVDYAL